MFYRVVILSTFLFSVFLARSQYNISGIVKLTNEDTLVASNHPVLLYNLSETIDTTYTDAQGRFSFDIPNNTGEKFIIKTLGYCDGWEVYVDTILFLDSNTYNSIFEICHKEQEVYCSSHFNISRIDSLQFQFDAQMQVPDVIKYEWHFGDGVTVSTPSHRHYYRKRGVYEVRLIVETPFGYSDTTLKEVLASSESLVRGQVEIENHYLSDAFLWLIGFDYNQNSIIKIIYPNAQGNYSFWCKPYCRYMLKVIPDFDDENYSPRILPTYYNGTIGWRDASIIDVGYQIKNLNIKALSSHFYPHGFNTIEGSLIFPRGVDQIPVNVFLLDENKKAIDFTEVNDGLYSFKNLPTGIYYVLPEYVGKVSYSIRVVFNEDFDDPVHTQFVVSNTHINPLVISDLKTDPDLVNIYPVPIDNFITIETKYPIKNIKVRNITGKIIQTNTGFGSTKCKLKTSDWSKGSYFLEIIFKNKLAYYQQIVK